MRMSKPRAASFVGASSLVSDLANKYFHPSKCYVLRINESRNPIIHQYTMLNQALEVVDHQAYLGIIITETLSWKTHILSVKNKANKALGFIERNLHSCPERIKAQAYISLVRPTLESHVHRGTVTGNTKSTFSSKCRGELIVL